MYIPKDPVAAYCTAFNAHGRLKLGALKKLEEVVSQDPEYSYYFARDIPRANIKKLQEATRGTKWFFELKLCE